MSRSQTRLAPHRGLCSSAPRSSGPLKPYDVRRRGVGADGSPQKPEAGVRGRTKARHALSTANVGDSGLLPPPRFKSLQCIVVYTAGVVSGFVRGCADTCSREWLLSITSITHSHGTVERCRIRSSEPNTTAAEAARLFPPPKPSTLGFSDCLSKPNTTTTQVVRFLDLCDSVARSPPVAARAARLAHLSRLTVRGSCQRGTNHGDTSRTATAFPFAKRRINPARFSVH
jgi:hypothetical protein